MQRLAYVLGFAAALSATTLTAEPAEASEVMFRGHVVQTQGHTNPACRMVFIKRSDTGAIIPLRLGNYTGESSVSAISITALTTGLEVQVDYDNAVTSGCGTEPVISWLAIFAPGY